MPAAETTSVLAQIPTLDTLLGAYAGALRRDFEALGLTAAAHLAAENLDVRYLELLGSKEEALK